MTQGLNMSHDTTRRTSGLLFILQDWNRNYSYSRDRYVVITRDVPTYFTTLSYFCLIITTTSTPFVGPSPVQYFTWNF